MTYMRTTVPCELCGTATPMLGTKRCDRCWELETRIKQDLLLALKILRPQFEAEIKKANRLVRRRELSPLRRAAELAVTYIKDGSPGTAKARLEGALATLIEQQGRRRAKKGA